MFTVGPNRLVAVDLETTGIDPLYDDILQFAAVPLDVNLEPDPQFQPMYCLIHPAARDRVEAHDKAMYDKAVQCGWSFEVFTERLESWATELLDGTVGAKIAPLGHNYAFDARFLSLKLGNSFYERFFHHRYRDTQIAAAYLSDRSTYTGEKTPFQSTSLEELCSRLGIINDCPHDALADCLATARVYRSLLMGSWL